MATGRHVVSLPFRATASVTALALGSGVVLSQVSDGLYPYVPVALFVALTAVLAGSRVDRGSSGQYLTLAVAVGVGFTVYVFTFPESLIGIDPNRLVVDIQQLRTQGTFAVVESRFYSKVPFYLILPAMAGAVGGLPAQDVLVVYPPLVTAVVALSAALLAGLAYGDGRPFDRAKGDVDSGFGVVGVTAAVLGIGATTSLHFSYWPIPQTLAAVFFLSLVVVLVRDYVRPSRTWLAVAVALIWALAFTHKLPLVIVLPMLVGMAALTVARRTVRTAPMPASTRGRATTFVFGAVCIFVLWLYGTTFFTSAVFRGVGAVLFFLAVATVLYVKGPQRVKDGDGSSRSRLGHLGVLAVMAAAALSFQWVVLTNYSMRAFLRLWEFVGSDATVASSFGSSAPAAGPPGLPLFGVFFHHSNALVLLLAGGVAWLGIVTFRETGRKSATLLFGTAACLVPVALTALSPSVASPFRFLLFAEPLVVAVLAVAVGPDVRSQGTDIASVVVVLIVAILLFQVLSFLVVPDYGSSPRYYLTEQETDAKSFGLVRLEGTIGTDPFAVVVATREQITSPRFQDGDTYRPVETRLLSGTLCDRRPPYYMSRSIDVYRTNTGWWRLTYEPSIVLDAREHRVYDNGAVTINRRPGSPGAQATEASYARRTCSVTTSQFQLSLSFFAASAMDARSRSSA